VANRRTYTSVVFKNCIGFSQFSRANRSSW